MRRKGSRERKGAGLLAFFGARFRVAVAGVRDSAAHSPVGGGLHDRCWLSLPPLDILQIVPGVPPASCNRPDVGESILASHLVCTLLQRGAYFKLTLMECPLACSTIGLVKHKAPSSNGWLHLLSFPGHYYLKRPHSALNKWDRSSRLHLKACQGGFVRVHYVLIAHDDATW
ncbi:hypothetical protein MRX96_026923 [Rhipicephalus microplus]